MPTDVAIFITLKWHQTEQPIVCTKLFVCVLEQWDGNTDFE